MKKLVVSIFIAIFGISTNAQTIGDSPYAAYGIGDIKSNSSVESRSMGGISTAYIWDFNNHFNFQNPAANANLELTSIKLQGTNENIFVKSNDTKYNKNSVYLSGISIAFPLAKKVKFGLEFQPYSSKDYTITNSTLLNDGSTHTTKIYGEGSINKLQAGLGMNITPEFALGVASHLYFGKLYDTQEITNTNSTNISSVENTLNMSNFNFTVGSTYQKKLKNNKKFTLGATYTFGNTSDIDANYTTSTYTINNNQKQYQNKVEASRNIKNPIGQEVSFGIGYGHDAKWFISSQLNYKTKSKNTDSNQGFEYQDSYRLAVGGWYLPNFNNFRNYFSRVTYRYGAFYEKGSLKINNTSVDKYGIAMGLSLPFQNFNINRFSSVDLGLELGQRSTLKNNLIRENFVNLTIGINFANKWFEKQYYD